MSIFSDIAGLAAIATAYDDLGTVGTTAQTKANTLGTDLYSKAKFDPFSIVSDVATTDVFDAYGNVNIGLKGQPKEIQDALLTQTLSNLRAPSIPGLLDTRGFGTNLFGRATTGLDETLPTYALTNLTARDNLSAGRGFLREAEINPAAREQEIFKRIRLAQAEDEAQQALELEERLASQGRLGVSTNLYGGTPEQLALAKAQAQARNAAMIDAMQQAQAERQLAGELSRQFSTTGAGLGQAAQDLLTGRQSRALQLGEMGLGMFSGAQGLETDQLRRALAATQGAFIPQSAALDVFQSGLTAGGMAQQAQQFRTGMLGEARTAGINALLASGLGRADLLGEVGAGVLAAGARSDDTGLFDKLKEIFS